MQPTKTQKQQETQNSLHHLSAALSGEKVPSETVPLHRGESGVLQLPQPHRDTSQDLVSKPQGQGQETAGGRDGETEAGSEASAAGLRLPLPTERADGRTGALRRLERTETRLTCTGTIQRSLWDVLPVLILPNFKRVEGKCLHRENNQPCKNVHPTSQTVEALNLAQLQDFTERKKEGRIQEIRFTQEWNGSIN